MLIKIRARVTSPDSEEQIASLWLVRIDKPLPKLFQMVIISKMTCRGYQFSPFEGARDNFHYFMELGLIALSIQHKSRRLQKCSINMFDGDAIEDFTGQNSMSEWRIEIIHLCS